MLCLALVNPSALITAGPEEHAAVSDMPRQRSHSLMDPPLFWLILPTYPQVFSQAQEEQNGKPEANLLTTHAYNATLRLTHITAITTSTSLRHKCSHVHCV